MKKCWNCHQEIPDDDLVTYDGLSFHDLCRDQYISKHDDITQEYLKLKTVLMFDRAVHQIGQSSNNDDYYEEAQIVKQFALKDLNKFQSSDEMMTAMELLKNRIQMKAQYKVFNYRVDFLLPDLKVCLEIDGMLHNYKQIKDSKRDVKILNALNEESPGWEFVRIPTDLLERNIQRLVPAIKAVYKAKQEERRKHNGFLPTNWSATNRAAQISVVSPEDDDSTKAYRILISRELKKQI
ncbi:MAG: DUF559 domain-containing protein [Companilactobacillus sp.]|jgi:very-short-patch-repair endonuclease|nr:DUF559 domain-containing protein [Companilactobacillus sp.]